MCWKQSGQGGEGKGHGFVGDGVVAMSGVVWEVFDRFELELAEQEYVLSLTRGQEEGEVGGVAWL